MTLFYQTVYGLARFEPEMKDQEQFFFPKLITSPNQLGIASGSQGELTKVVSVALLNNLDVSKVSATFNFAVIRSGWRNKRNG